MAKTATFGVMHLVTSFTVTYALTGSVSIAGIVTFVEPLVNTVMHYFFDKYWDHPKVEAARAVIARMRGRRVQATEQRTEQAMEDAAQPA